MLALAASFVCVLVTFTNLGTDAAPRVVHGFEWIRYAWGNGSPGKRYCRLRVLCRFADPALDALCQRAGHAHVLYASEYMAGDVRTAGYSRFFAAFNLFVFSMSCLVMGGNLLMLFLGWRA